MERIELSESYRRLLLQTPPFDALSAERAESFPEGVGYDLFRIYRGDVIVRQGTPCNFLYVLLQGRLRVDIVDAFGNRILIEHIESPRVFATPHLFGADNTMPATFTVLDEGILFAATRESAFRLISEEPGILRKFLCITGNCNHCTVKRLRILSFKGIRERLAIYLLDRLSPGVDYVPIVHNNSQLADYLNVTRPALSKEIGKLKKEEIVVVGDDRIKLLDISVLQAVVNRADK